MKKKSLANIRSVGKCIPRKKIDNNHFVKLGLDTSDNWIKERTGIETRFFTTSETSSDLGYQAAKNALESGNCDASELDMIICATTTPDYLGFPSTACLIQKKLNCKTIMSFDISAACTGFSYGLNIASQFIMNHSASKILLVGVDCLSKFCDFEDRKSCILFGDGAGAIILEKSLDYGIIYSKNYSDGGHESLLYIQDGGSQSPFQKNISHFEPYIKMEGKSVFKLAVLKVTESISEALKELNLNISDISYFILHQANLRILEKIKEKLNIQDSQFLTNVNKYGNTSAASIPILMNESKKKFKRNDIIIIAGFGAGFTWGVNIIKWSK